MYLTAIFLIARLFSHSVICAPIRDATKLQIPSAKVLNFMKQFGYLESDTGDSEALYTENGISEIIKTIQRFGAIEETGIIDNETLKLMSSRRCGVPDIIKHKRKRRFAIGSDGWGKRNITYFIANWSPKLGKNNVVKNIQKALDIWGGYGRLTFRRVSSPDADIIVAFGTGDHGDAYPFDGRGIVLAHAFFPYEDYDLGGDIHFDDDENWIDKSEDKLADGPDFFTVALHELGHSLGLAHSTVPSSVMFPYYKDYSESTAYQLDYDDILGMYNLYITKVLKDDYNTPATSSFEDDETTSEIYRWSSSPTTEFSYFPEHTFPVTHPAITDHPYSSTAITSTSTVNSAGTVLYEGDDESVDDHKKHDNKHNVPNTNSPSLPNICEGHVDAIATLRDELFVFKEQYIWRYKDKGKLQPGYPVPFTQMFPNLPESIKKIDAVYERPDGMIIIFTGKMFWVYDGTNFVENSPKPLVYYGLPDYIDDIDAVQTWGRNKKTYFYKKERFWRYNETAKTMDPGYPMHVERWRGIPENLDAATTWKDGSTYFFKGELFWKFDNDWVIVTEQSPLPTAEIWFGCPEEERKMIRLFN